VLALVLGESILLLLIGGVVGMGLAAIVAPGVSKGSGGMVQLPPVGASNWLQALVVMVVIGIAVGLLPAMRAMRLKIVDALAGR
jgi:putative ABC transport system permease protein